MSATDDIVSGIMTRWADNFSSFDAEAQASLYSKNALFYGSKPTLYRGQDGVASYFDGLQKWSFTRGDSSPTWSWCPPAGNDVINVAGIANFVIDEGVHQSLGQDHLGDCARRRRLEDRQPSRLVAGAH